MRDYPADAASVIESYADDLSALESSSDLSIIECRLVDAVASINAWAKSQDLSISPDKSHLTLFTPDTHQFNRSLIVPIDGTPIPMNRNPKILGVTLDPLFTFSPHISSIAAQAASKLKILRALVGQGWRKKFAAS